MARRLKLRFSMRRLVVVTAILCLYFACWMPTQTRGVDDVYWRCLRKHDAHAIVRAVPVLPLVLRVDVVRLQTSFPRSFSSEYSYCLWFFGLTAHLPISFDE